MHGIKILIQLLKARSGWLPKLAWGIALAAMDTLLIDLDNAKLRQWVHRQFENGQNSHFVC